MKARKNGYTITLLFFWLQSIELAKERVKTRVLEGGHDIPPEIIERRYKKGIKNLFDIYFPIVDGIMVFDNSAGKPELLVHKTLDGKIKIINEPKFNEIRRIYENC